MNDLASKAQQVRQIHDEMREAFTTENDAKAKLLKQLLEDLRPALPPLSQRLGDIPLNGQRGIVVPCVAGSPLMVLTAAGQFVVVDSVLASSQPRVASLHEAARYLSLPTLTNFLHEQLDRQLNGKATNRTKQALRTAARLEALATLLKEERC